MEHAAKVAGCEKAALLFFFFCADSLNISANNTNKPDKKGVQLSSCYTTGIFILPHILRFLCEAVDSSRQLWKAVHLLLSLSGLVLFRSGMFLKASRACRCTEAVDSLTSILQKPHPAPCHSWGRGAGMSCPILTLPGCPHGLQALETTLLLLLLLLLLFLQSRALRPLLSRR